mmetsp:Transcript_4951/g.4200  ORF Transcript_4951/g.4200 Transcript_4951/m.4200 type:complete len:154 (+) Transcript_4951:150-611(+)
MCVRKKETLPPRMRMNIPGMDSFDDFAEDTTVQPVAKDKFFNIIEREYTEKELKKKINNIRKGNAPYELLDDLIPQERLEGHRITEVYNDVDSQDNAEEDDNLELVIEDEDYGENENQEQQNQEQQAKEEEDDLFRNDEPEGEEGSDNIDDLF